MRSVLKLRTLMLVLVLTVFAAACASDDTEDTADTAAETTEAATTEEAMADDEMADDEMADDEMAEEGTTEDAMADDEMAQEGTTEDAMAEEAVDSTTICEPDALVEAVQNAGEQGTLEGMADDPVATAASNNPVLTTLVTAVGEAGLVDTLNSAEALTVFAPTDCAFAGLDQATLDAALADPSGLLTQVLGLHVIVGEQISSDQLSGEYETFAGDTITVEGSTVAGQAEILVPDIMTANATVHLIDSVILPQEG